ncbi:YjfB family protein [Psychrobacillus psychrotolerans]|nr:YjfB family protein [Psychrobacillus psychrotolerans]
MSVMKQAMGSAEKQGNALQNLMTTTDVSAIQQAAQPHLGGNIDLKLIEVFSSSLDERLLFIFLEQNGRRRLCSESPPTRY